MRPKPLPSRPKIAQPPQMFTFRNSVCPHDWPSTCALEIEILVPDRIGNLLGTSRIPSFRLL